MNILVINCGSSSIKTTIIDAATGVRSAEIRIDGVGEADCTLHIGRLVSALPAHLDHDAALARIFTELEQFELPIDGVGHRIAHGGERFSQPTVIDTEIEAAIEALVPLAPLHNPACLAGIRAARRLLPEILQVAVFDTAFHSTLPNRARAYALPKKVVDELGIRRYGFHGISHEYVAQRAAEYLGADLRKLRLISCHLGNGCSVTAIEYGRSVETSMGMTPLEGLVMGTRSGDIDPGVSVQLLREHKLSVDELDQLLNRNSGLLGMTGVNDMQEIEDRAAQGCESARLAIQVFTHRLRKYIGAYAAVMGGVDAIMFTGGIGEHSALIRHRVAQRLDFLGARIDENHNRNVRLGENCQVAEFSTSDSQVRLLVVAADEEQQIAKRTAQAIDHSRESRRSQRIPIAVSVRHVHLTESSIETLFGIGHELTVAHPLSQPGQYAAEETVTLRGPKHSIEHVRVLGPPRSEDQVEISRTDEFTLGIDAPVRASGDTQNSPGIALIGPEGTVDLTTGVICAWRHIHMEPHDAESRGLQDGDVVDVAIDGGDRDLQFGDVLIRVRPDYRLEMHLDTDEANAAGLNTGDDGALVAVKAQAVLVARKLPASC